MSFSRTLQKGLERFNKAKAAASGSVFTGQDAFELYDTFGFPPDLTQVWCCWRLDDPLMHTISIVTLTCTQMKGNHM